MVDYTPMFPFRAVPVEYIRWLPAPCQCPNCEHPLFLELDNRNLQPLQVACPRCDYCFTDVKARPVPGITEHERLSVLRSSFRNIAATNAHFAVLAAASIAIRLPQRPDIDAMPDLP